MKKVQEKPNKNAQRNIINFWKKIWPVLIFFIGLIILLYPVISGVLSKHNQTCVINDYIKEINTFSDDE